MPTQASLTTILEADLVSNGPAIINPNFAALNLNGTELSAGNLQIATNAQTLDTGINNLAITPSKLEHKMINAQNIMPKTTNIYSLGSTTQQFSSLWLSNDIHFNDETLFVNSAGDILINGNVFTGPSLTGQFVELTGAQNVAGIKTFLNQMNLHGSLSLSGNSLDVVFNETGNGNSGILFKDNGTNVCDIKYIDASLAIKVNLFDAFTHSFQFTDEVIFGEGVKTAPDFTSGVADNGITASKIKRYKRHVNDSVTSLSGAQVNIDWSGSPVFNLYPDEGESGQVIVAQNETDIFLPPLTRDGGATNSGGTLYTIVNLSNNVNVEIFADSSIGDLINGTTSLSNSTRFNTITIIGTYKKQFGTGSKEGHWVVISEKGTWS